MSFEGKNVGKERVNLIKQHIKTPFTRGDKVNLHTVAVALLVLRTLKAQKLKYHASHLKNQ
jgi:hypothetical protein